MKLIYKPKSAQQSHWNEVFTKDDNFFGGAPSSFGQCSLELFQKNGGETLLELGCGQGRDSLLFASNGLQVTALDYSKAAISNVIETAERYQLSGQLNGLAHKLTEPLPFADNSFDACYSHMLLCMELSTAEIAFIMRETHRVLRPGGLAVYSVRSNFDKHYQQGRHLGEDLYEIGGFVVHFFTEAKIRRLSNGYEILNIERVEEGSLPRDLFCVALKKDADPDSWVLDPEEDAACLRQPLPPDGETVDVNAGKT